MAGMLALLKYPFYLSFILKYDVQRGARPEGDDGRRKSSKLSRRWLRPTLAAVASLRGCAMAEFKS